MNIKIIIVAISTITTLSGCSHFVEIAFNDSALYGSIKSNSSVASTVPYQTRINTTNQVSEVETQPNQDVLVKTPAEKVRLGNSDVVLYKPLKRSALSSIPIDPEKNDLIKTKAKFKSFSDTGEKWFLNNEGYAWQVATFSNLNNMQRFLKKRKHLIAQSKVDTWLEPNGRRYTVFYKENFTKIRDANSHAVRLAELYKVKKTKLWLRGFKRLSQLRCRDIDRQIASGKPTDPATTINNLKQLANKNCQSDEVYRVV